MSGLGFLNTGISDREFPKKKREFLFPDSRRFVVSILPGKVAGILLIQIIEILHKKLINSLLLDFFAGWCA